MAFMVFLFLFTALLRLISWGSLKEASNFGGSLERSALTWGLCCSRWFEIDVRNILNETENDVVLTETLSRNPVNLLSLLWLLILTLTPICKGMPSPLTWEKWLLDNIVDDQLTFVLSVYRDYYKLGDAALNWKFGSSCQTICSWMR